MEKTRGSFLTRLVVNFLTVIAATVPLFLLISLSSISHSWPDSLYILSGRESSMFAENGVVTRTPGMPTANIDESVQSLIDSIREATQEAIQVTRRNGGPELTSFSQAEREQWNRENPCRSRLELGHFYGRRRAEIATNPQWEMVLREYEILHRTCIKAAGNLTEYFYSRNSSTGCKFVFADSRTGLGNKILHVTGSLLYAILTQRVIVISASTNIPDVMCEPFHGSTWKLPVNLIDSTETWNQTWDFLRDVGADRAGNLTMPMHAAGVGFYFQGQPSDDMDRFFCVTEQAYFTRIPWVFMHGCLHFLPKLFAIPSFRPVLEALFPDPSLTLTHMLRSAMLPADHVWDRVRTIHEVHLADADSQIGYQVRYLHNPDRQYKELNDVVNFNIWKCSLDNGFLPAVSNGSSHENLFITGPHRRTIKVLIASLFMGLHDHLNNIYLRNPTTSGDKVGLVQLTHDNEQQFGLEVDNQALVEIILLSFSDTIFVTGGSTFGGIAHAYGALTPWFMEKNKDHTPSCTQGQTSDVCFQSAGPHYKCPYEPSINQKYIPEVVPYFVKCLWADSWGYQLLSINNNRSSAS